MFGPNFKFLRTKTGADQTEFGKIFNLSRGSVGNIEKGGSPDLELLIAVREKFSVSLDDLVYTDLTQNQQLIGGNAKTRGEMSMEIEILNQEIEGLRKQIIDAEGLRRQIESQQKLIDSQNLTIESQNMAINLLTKATK